MKFKGADFEKTNFKKVRTRFSSEFYPSKRRAKLWTAAKFRFDGRRAKFYFGVRWAKFYQDRQRAEFYLSAGRIKFYLGGSR
jgi:hypothetical protein